MKIEKEARNLCIAMAIGDGTINSNGYIAIRHCSAQKDYLEWKKQQLKNVNINTTDLYHIDNSRYGVQHDAYELRTYTHNFLKLYRKIIYKPTKTLSRKLLNRLDLLGIAIWYMDDGSLSNRKDTCGKILSSVLTISTCTTREQNQIIIDYFKEVWGIQFGQRKMKNHFALICGTKEARKFIALIAPVVNQVPSMKYKLNVKP